MDVSPASAEASATSQPRDAGLRTAEVLLTELRHEVDSVLRQNSHIFEKEYSWGLLYRMYQRAADHADACILLAVKGRFPAAEALCRTLVESAVNLYYCSLGDSVDHILSYFKAHIATERKQNNDWKASVCASAMTQEAKDDHLMRIQRKEAALASRERFLVDAFKQIGYSYTASRGVWPSIYERFREIRKEVDYRTTYAALCSQAHNDPEDLLNEFVSQSTGTKEKQRVENERFATFMVLASISLLTEGTAMYLGKFLDPGKIMALRERAQQAAFDMTEGLPPIS